MPVLKEGFLLHMHFFGWKEYALLLKSFHEEGLLHVDFPPSSGPLPAVKSFRAEGAMGGLNL